MCCELFGLAMKLPPFMGAEGDYGFCSRPGLVEHRAEHGRARGVEVERVADRCMPDRLEIENSADRHTTADQIARQVCSEVVPVGGQHNPGQMAPC